MDTLELKKMLEEKSSKIQLLDASLLFRKDISKIKSFLNGKGPCPFYTDKGKEDTDKFERLMWFDSKGNHFSIP